MSGGWIGGHGEANFVSYGMSATDSGLTAVTCGAANTKGSYAQLTASTSADARWIRVFVSGVSATGAALSADIAVGAGGSEKVVIPDVAIQLHGTTEFRFPLDIPAGSRIAARAQSSTASDTAKVAIIASDSSWNDTVGGSIVDCLGFVSSTSKGTTIDAGATANTKGAYVQLIASTAADYSGFVLCCTHPSGAAVATAHLLMDLAVGASGSEKIVLSNHYVRNTSFGSTQSSASAFLGMPIKSGSRVAARCQASVTTSPSRTLLVTVYGVRA